MWGMAERFHYPGRELAPVTVREIGFRTRQRRGGAMERLLAMKPFQPPGDIILGLCNKLIVCRQRGGRTLRR